MDWKPAPIIMCLGHIQDQKVHISSSGLDVAKSIARTADLEKTLLFQLENLWQQLTFWGRSGLFWLFEVVFINVK